MRARLLLALWLLGILFPMAWLGRFSAGYRQAFNTLFHPTWVHVVMHAGLFAGLVLLLGWALNGRAGGRNPLLGFCVVLCVGVLQEGLQAYSQGALSVSGAIFDLGVDLTGGAVGWLLLGLLRRWEPYGGKFLARH